MQLVNSMILAAALSSSVALEATQLADAPLSAAALASHYDCEGQAVSINFVLGSQIATFENRQWRNVEIVNTTGFHPEDDEHYPATQYRFEREGKQFFFVTGRGRTESGALLLPDSDDFLYCEALGYANK